MLESIGIDGPDWLNDPTWIYPSLVLIGLWGIGSAIIINLAGPAERADRAVRRGARRRRRLVGPAAHVTMPLMSPVIFYSITLGTIGVLQYFLVPLVLNTGDGRPGRHDVLLQRLHLQDLLHLPGHVGGATLAWFLFVIILAITLVLFWSSRLGCTCPSRGGGRWR